MASTNKTANIHLNQWAASDPVLREDFNADNAAIDAAFDNILVRKLAEYTTTQAAQAVEFDLSGIDPDDYAELRLQLYMKPAQDGSMYQSDLYFNETAFDSTNITYLYPTDINHLLHFNAPLECMLSRAASNPPAIWDIRLVPSPAGSNQYRLYTGTMQVSYLVNGSVQLVQYAFTLYTDQLNKLIIKKHYDKSEYAQSTDIGVGSKLLIYGVKK